MWTSYASTLHTYSIFLKKRGTYMTQPRNKFEEVTIRTEPIFQGKVISLQVDHVRLPNGETATREIIRHPGAVAVLALLGDKMLVVEQYRKPLGKSQVEIPAGKLEKGEDPLEAARRELEEETGYRCGSIRHLSSFYTSPGFADEILHLYVSEQIVPGVASPDEDEFLECEAITLEQAQQYMREQRISDAKTVTAVYAWQVYQLTGRF
jgi:ADP-ribose pyrophosphatase